MINNNRTRTGQQFLNFDKETTERLGAPISFFAGEEFPSAPGFGRRVGALQKFSTAFASIHFSLCRKSFFVTVAAMDTRVLLDGLMAYCGFIPLLTLHEFGHAWMAWKCGDDTARLLGRITVNPLAHMEFVGTVVLPLLAIFLSASSPELAGLIIGWGKPVPVNPSNLRHPRRDGTLVALAGPAMNVLLAVGLIAIAKVGDVASIDPMVSICRTLALQSLFLCFFNLLPIPPLDGSHVVKNLIGMSYETYWRISQFGFFIVIVVMQIKEVRWAIKFVTYLTWGLIRIAFRV